MPESTPTVFVVDDDESVREGLQELLHAAGWEVEAFASAQEFEAAARAGARGCLILDVRLPDGDGLDLQARLTALRIDLPIVFITGHGDIPMSVRAMKAGAVEFLPKPFLPADLLAAVDQAVARDRLARRADVQHQELRRRFASLTPRERQVMDRVVAGQRNKQVATELGTRLVTIKVHRGRVMAKMGARSLPELVRMAAQVRDDPPPDVATPAP